MKKKLLIIGGSKISTEIVNKAKEMNIKTYVTDFYPIDKSPAKQISDVALVTDSTDLNKQLLDIENNDIDGVLTGFTDSALPFYVKIANLANLNSYANSEQVFWLNNKENYKKLCRDFKVPTTEEYSIDLTDETEFDNLEFPVLIKPTDSSGAKGVYVVKNKCEFKKKIEKSLEFSKTKNILVEKYYDCEEVTAFFYIQNGEIYLTSVADRIVQYVNDYTIKLPTGYIFPSKYTKTYVETVLPKIKKMFKSLDLKNGMIFVQCLVDGENIRLYDLGYRLTGSLEYKIFEKMYGFNTLEMLINHSIYGDDGEPNLPDKLENPIHPFGANVTILGKPGVIDAIEGVGLLMNHPNVIDIYMNYDINDTILEESLGTLKQVISRIFIIADSKKDLKSTIDFCKSNLKVTNELGESLIISDMNVD
ncbi:ATP-grasp domain-containing protein [Macrococcus armenti]|uniref:ATP-grasp domain-containing protein n=1 Tax=Macrococcus armenti TaxID=2875764 RepID=UPI001CCF1564|nr:ATP-grasp domain-containing protein [Macrococcus armenti]UBH16126.1 ATP-grasp domain-containing protein [Macrococcus armenti]UBH18486.1 ATP-grasp domain-containing protein [Macrococcus armenti]UBH20753.1 ATP-grasp domain-containing protein [Macrococcus armenti]